MQIIKQVNLVFYFILDYFYVPSAYALKNKISSSHLQTTACNFITLYDLDCFHVPSA